MEMRRKERAVTRAEAEQYLKDAEVGYLSLAVNNTPYVVPLNFVLLNNTIYFHCANVGRKLEMLKANPQCCFLVSVLDGIKGEDAACDYGAYFHSAIAEGNARWVEESDEKLTALTEITKKHAMAAFSPVTPERARATTVIAIDIATISGKARKK